MNTKYIKSFILYILFLDCPQLVDDLKIKDREVFSILLGSTIKNIMARYENKL